MRKKVNGVTVTLQNFIYEANITELLANKKSVTTKKSIVINSLIVRCV